MCNLANSLKGLDNLPTLSWRNLNNCPIQPIIYLVKPTIPIWCGWKGVVCGGSPQSVIELNLNRMSLSGFLPSNLNNLKKLTKLNLGHNNIT